MEDSFIIPLYGAPQKVLVRSYGCYHFDSLGKKYIDFESGVWCANIGHCNKTISNVIRRQIARSIHHGYRFRNSESEELAKKLNRITGLKKAQSSFLCSGSEAVNLAIKIAMHVTKKTKLVKIDNTFLSAYGYGRIGDDNLDKIDIEFNNINSIKKTDFSTASCVVIEVGGASIDTVQFPSVDYIEQLVAKARENHCLIIANEVTTGFGRTGKWFGYMHYDLKPDIVVTGKGLGNGYPISAVTVKESFANLLTDSSFRYAQSHQNDPLGCAVANSVIEYFEKRGMVEMAHTTGHYFQQRCLAFMKKYPNLVKEIRGKGLMLAMEFSESVDVASLNLNLFESGFIVGCKHKSLRFMPPLNIQKSMINQLLNRMEELIV